MTELRERFIFPGGSALWVKLRYVPRIGEQVTIHADSAQCRNFNAVTPAVFFVTAVEYEIDYSDREDGDELLSIYLEAELQTAEDPSITR